MVSIAKGLPIESALEPNNCVAQYLKWHLIRHMISHCSDYKRYFLKLWWPEESAGCAKPNQVGNCTCFFYKSVLEMTSVLQMKRLAATVTTRMTVNIACGAWLHDIPKSRLIAACQLFCFMLTPLEFQRHIVGGQRHPYQHLKPADMLWPFKNSSTPNWKTLEPSLSRNSGSFSTLFSTMWDIETTMFGFF